MKTKTSPRPTDKVTVELPDLGLTRGQMTALKKEFKNDLVATLGAIRRPLCLCMIAGKHRGRPKSGRIAKKTKPT